MLCFVIVKKRIERRKVMSCYHVSKNSRSQNSFLAETAVALSKDGRKEWATNALFKKKEERLGKHELKLYFTFTQKWSSTKYTLIFGNKWKLLHEKRVQSRQYFWGGYSTWPESCFVVVVSVFVLFSMSPPWWSIAEISSGKVSTLDLRHTDDTDASVQRTSIAKLHNP